MFELHRAMDATGISGIGVVAEGVEYTDGRVSMRWRTIEMPASTCDYDSIDDVLKIHGHGGSIRVVWSVMAERLGVLEIVARSVQVASISAAMRRQILAPIVAFDKRHRAEASDG